jgi:hypothetical protein
MKLRLLSLFLCLSYATTHAAEISISELSNKLDALEKRVGSILMMIRQDQTNLDQVLQMNPLKFQDRRASYPLDELAYLRKLGLNPKV